MTREIINVADGTRTQEPLWMPPVSTLTAQEQLDAKRAAVTMPRGDFLAAAVTLGVITSAVAVEAAGGNWPSAFDAFLVGLPVADQIAAKETWASGLDVRRSAALLAQIAAAQVPPITDAQLDTMFGIT